MACHVSVTKLTVKKGISAKNSDLGNTDAQKVRVKVAEETSTLGKFLM